MHAEVLGNKVIPSSEDIIDSSRVPLFLLRAAKAGIPTLPFLVTDSAKKIVSELGFPVLIFAVNPFIHEGYKIAKNRSALYRAMKSLGMNYKFAVCAQPLRGEIVTLKTIFGECGANEEERVIAEKVYSVFKIPICKLHIQKVENRAFLCSLQPLSKNEITIFDSKLISEKVSRFSTQGEESSG